MKRKKTGYAISTENLIDGSVANTLKEIKRAKRCFTKDEFHQWLKDNSITILNSNEE